MNPAAFRGGVHFGSICRTGSICLRLDVSLAGQEVLSAGTALTVSSDLKRVIFTVKRKKRFVRRDAVKQGFLFRVFRGDGVPCSAAVYYKRKAAEFRAEGRRQSKAAVVLAVTEQIFEHDRKIPAGRARIPRPAAATVKSVCGADVAAERVRLAAVFYKRILIHTAVCRVDRP